MIELTEQQQREIRNSSWPPRFLNPSTHETFVLLPTEMYDRARSFLDKEDEIDSVEEMYPLVNEALDTSETDGTVSKESA